MLCVQHLQVAVAAVVVQLELEGLVEIGVGQVEDHKVQLDPAAAGIVGVHPLEEEVHMAHQPASMVVGWTADGVVAQQEAESVHDR